MQNSTLSIANIGKVFCSNQVLRSISLDIRPGEVLALMGENGAGKSTLLKILSGALEPTSGSIQLGDTEITLRSPHDAFRHGIRVVHQEPDILPFLSVAENIFLGDLPLGRSGIFVDRARLFDEAARLMATFRVGLDVAPQSSAADLSPAQRQMIEILRALRNKPAFLALDEPTSSLTQLESQDLFRVINHLRSDGVAIIYVSHRMKEVHQLADRVAVLRDGALIGVRPAQEATEQVLVQMMVGREVQVKSKDQSHATDSVALALSNVTGPYLNNVSISICRGEVVALAGLVGAGRSEVARTIYGTVPVHSGNLSLMEQPFSPTGPKHAIQHGIGYAPEERKAEALLMLLGIRENISLTALARLTRFGLINRAREISFAQKFAGSLRIKATSNEQIVSELSGGNQQKVVLARWLGMGPGVLILDEPTRGIDVGVKSEIYRLIEELAADGIAILLISSELPEVLRLSDRIYVMQSGQIKGELSSRDATEEKILQLAMANDLTARVLATTSAQKDL